MAEDRLRIALTVYRGNPTSGGQGVYTAELARRLVARGHSVTVVSGPPYPALAESIRLEPLGGLDLLRQPDPFRRPRLDELTDAYDLAEVALLATGAFPDPRAFGLRFRAWWRREGHRFDLVHDNQSLTPAHAELVRDGVPVVAAIHHPITVDRQLALAAAGSVKERIGLRRFFGFVPMQVRTARVMPRVLTVSSASARDISRELGVARSRLRVVPIGVDAEVFRPLEGVQRTATLLATTASADVPLKGLGVLLLALARLPSDVELVVMGPRREGSPIEALIGQLGLGERVHLVGAVSRERMVEVYASAAVAVVPSMYEGFSLPAVEAMACGVPLVATTGGALAEVVGGLAPQVPPGDPVALAQAIAAQLADPAGARERAASARSRVLARYSWDEAARRTEQVYREVLEA
ncbi:glycosyl transferase group 1 [Acidimicrobium ferrooxidans DSM 10331]|uniref:Glycosyl transferase group 1 n=1 Tax=Acidimicrobium ferrooxidans (strain DSM 10331 / JCM 15462 / NBRC 103882 / ICP) TaxID=525909 RepID=C7M362_ACIFD|nr:glycosyltransferase family 4 protein [Acidimicrobium ferrooxidans]ACU53456.1 glycosyl transferase group 1 [Acidimicrobium ferrooxidans DSM 10331]